MKKSKKLVSILSLSIFLSSIGCSFDNTIPTTNINNISNLLNKGASLSKASLKIDTGLVEKVGKSISGTRKIINLNELYDNGSFSIKSKKSKDDKVSKNLFKETIPLNKSKKVSLQKEFKVNDITKKYTLFFNKNDDQKTNDIITGSISINGNSILYNSELKYQEEIISDSLSLNSINTINIDLESKNNTSVTIMIAENSDFGNLRKSSQLEESKHSTNDQHIKSKDSNIFDETLESLNGLVPYEGEITTQNSYIKVGLADADGDISPIRIGRVVVDMTNPSDQQIQTLLTRYNATLIDKMPVMDDRVLVTIELDLNNAKLNGFVNNFDEMNKVIEEPILNASFSSLSTAKTVAVFYDILVNSKDIANNASLDFYQDDINSNNNSFSVQSATSDTTPIVTQEDLANNFKSDQFWWLSNSGNFSPNITQAWDYSYGYNTVVAVIDEGFRLIDQYPEYKNKVIYNKEFNRYYETGSVNKCMLAENNGYNSLDGVISGNLLFPDESVYRDKCFFDQALDKLNVDSIPTQIYYKTIKHGLMISSFITSFSDDKKSISGVSPRSKVIPMGVNSNKIQMLTYRLSQLYYYISKGNNVDVVNISFGFKDLDFYGSRIANVSNEKIYVKKVNRTFRNIQAIYIQRLINSLKNDFKVIVVASAGNNGENNIILPSCFDNVISVGAYQRKGTDIEKAVFKELIKEFPTMLSSNYHTKIDLWGPGSNMFTMIPNTKIQNWSYELHKNVEGTSFSAPIISGVVALLKSIKRDITFEQVISILKDTGYTINNSSFPLSKGQKAINVLSAIKHPSLNAQKVRDFEGYYSDGKINITKSAYHSIGDTVFIDEDSREIYKDLNNSTVRVSGWFSPRSSILVQQMYEINENPIPSPSPTPINSPKYYVRIYNVDDTSYAYINLNNVYSTTYSQDKSFDITSLIKEGDNTINFKTYNYSGGYTWGFQLIKDSTIIWDEHAGLVGSNGANNNDQSKTNQYVYDKTIMYNTDTGKVNVK